MLQDLLASMACYQLGITDKYIFFTINHRYVSELGYLIMIKCDIQ